MTYIDLFDIVSGKVVQNEWGIFWFKGAGNNLENDGWPITGNLHRVDGPAAIWPNGVLGWHIDGRVYTEDEFRKRVEVIRQTTI